MPGQKAVAEERLEDARQQFAQAKEEVQKPFDKEDELKYVQNRLTKINAELDMEPKTEPKLVKKEELKNACKINEDGRVYSEIKRRKGI